MNGLVYGDTRHIDMCIDMNRCLNQCVSAFCSLDSEGYSLLLCVCDLPVFSSLHVGAPPSPCPAHSDTQSPLSLCTQGGGGGVRCASGAGGDATPRRRATPSQRRNQGTLKLMTFNNVEARIGKSGLKNRDWKGDRRYMRSGLGVKEGPVYHEHSMGGSKSGV